MKYLIKNIHFVFVTILIIIFFYKFFLKNLIPFPGDMLVGAYYPWLDYSWSGLTTSIPIKNPLISDVFSQLYLWKNLIIDSFNNREFPLWNIYSYSGYPLFANFQSGILNPLNLLLILFGNQTGWSLLIISQFFISLITFYLLLKEFFPKNTLACFTGSTTYAFSGYMIVWSQFVTAGFAMAWLPLIILNIEKYFKTKKNKYLKYLPVLYFLTMTAGHLQALFYVYLLSVSYYLYKLYIDKKFNNKIKKYSFRFYLIIMFLGILLMSVQLLPSAEMAKNSVRFTENYISEYNFGLLSLDRIITLFAPDYFGNPTTFNFWGSFNYHETIIYCGILPVFAFLYCLYNFKKLKNLKFFLIALITSLLLTFNTYAGKLIYLIKFPILSTGAAGRITIISVFCLSFLTGYFINNVHKMDYKKSVRYFWGYLFFILIITISTYLIYYFNQNYPFSNNFKIGLRNLILPLAITFLTFLVISFIKNKTIKKIILLMIVISELFRFGWKYLPFVPSEYLYPSTEIINFLKKDNGIYRIEKEKGPLMTPNVWTYYSFQSPSGYDPMALNDYSLFFQKKFNQSKTGESSRYSEINNYDAQSLGEANVKYLLALNYNEISEITPNGNKLNYKIDTNEWHQVFRHKSISVLKNTKYKERFEIIGDNHSSVTNVQYLSNKAKLTALTSKPNRQLIFRDTWYPGWQATVNNKKVKIDKYLDIYRKINLEEGKNEVQFNYRPKSFYLGLIITMIGIVAYLYILIKNKDN